MALLIFFTSAAIAGCKKQDQDSMIERPVNDESVYSTLTNEEHLKLTEYLKSGAIIDSADFVNKINALKQESSQKNKSLYINKISSVTDGSSVSSEEINAANFLTLSASEVYQGEPDYYNVASVPATSGIRKAFKAINEEYSTFVIRGNRIKSVVPFVAVIDKYVSNNQGRLIKIAAQVGAPPFMLPDGPHWGVYAPVGQAYLQSNTIQGNTSIVDVAAMGNETRTIIRSTSNDVKITAEVDATIYKAGAELGAGWIISSSENVYNNYTLAGTLRITYNGAGFQDSYDLPGFSYFSSLKITQTGLLRN